MIDRLHAPMQAKRGQGFFLAVAERDGRTPKGDFEVGICLVLMRGP